MTAEEFYDQWIKIGNNKDKGIIEVSEAYYQYQRMQQDSFDQILREEFLINSQNLPKQYHDLFWEKYKRAEKRFKQQ